MTRNATTDSTTDSTTDAAMDPAIDPVLPAVADYLDTLAAALVGPRARRRAILDEALDGLLEAADAHLDDCADPDEAARRAVAEWGPPTAVAEAHNAAVRQRGIRHLVATACAALPVLAAVWCVAMLAGPAGPWERRPPAVDIGLVLLAFGCVFGAAAGLSGLRAGTGVRAVAPDTVPPDRAAAGAVSGLLLVLATLPAMVVNRGVTDPHSLAWPLIAPAVALNLGLAVYVATTWRRLRATAPARSRR